MLRIAGVLCLVLWLAGFASAADSPKKIVLIAGKKSHGPEGNGIHDYPWSVKLLKVMLDNSNVAEQVKVEYHLDGFPKDPTTLNDADSILVISDGRDGELYEEAPHFASPENLAIIQRQVQRGCGFAAVHFSTFGPDKYAAQSFEWMGGYFDWEEDGKRKWYSAIETRDADLTLASPEHAVLRGIKPFKMKEEFYFNIRFAPGDKTVTPLLEVAELPGREDRGKVVAWAKERPGGGRGFGTTCGHFYANWEREEFRTLVLNALVWTAGIDPPKEGVKARYYSRAEICAALSGVQGAERAIAKEQPIRVLLLAGNEAHEWHNWKKTTPVIKAALELDPRIKVDVSGDPEDLGKDSLAQYQVIVQNYCNWQDAKPLSDKARVGFADFISKGGGLVLVHFANGAWNFSLPMAGESDWPEYRKIVRRVWNHAGAGEAKSGHDAFGKFQVTPTKTAHEITSGITPFELEDELYYRQDGAEAVEPLITAHSKDTKRDEGLAWTYRYGEGRVFQTLLGHSEKTYDAFGPREMLRRAVAWCAKAPPMFLDDKVEAQLLPPKPADAPKAEAAPPDDKAKKSASLPEPKEGHWSHKGVGFGWQEADSADDRWKLTNHGRRLASILPLAKGTIAKGLTIRLGPQMEMCAAYDTHSATLRAVWTGGFLQFDPARYGIIAPPKPAGAMQLELPADFGWGDVTGKAIQIQHRSLNSLGQQTEIEFGVAGTTIRETPWTTQLNGQAFGLIREFEIETHDARLMLWLADQATATQATGEVKIQSRLPGRPVLTILAKGEGISLARAEKAGREVLGIVIPASQAKQHIRIAYGFGTEASLEKREDSAPLAKRVYKSKGARGKDDAALVLDRIDVPFDNPDKALFFITGHDFLAPGKLAVSTLHGDAWIVDGIDDDLEEITWTQFATGLFQPLGLKVRDGQIYVLGRDQITRLVDVNNDHVADRYECFCNQWNTPAGGHDYATCLEADSHGAFYFLDAVAGLQKVAADGSSIETIATGLRNPNGLGISPYDDITVAPQEGEWTPASFVGIARKGDHFGYLGPKASVDRPLGFTPPLLYLSRRIDNSCGGQVWVPDGAWGPLSGKMLHLSFGQCRMLLVQEEEVNGVRQAGATSLPLDFDSGVMRGRFSPFDGALYVSGSRGWVTRAAQDGCLTRVRYTGKPFVDAPVKVESRGNGFVFHFDTPLDRQTACDPGSYRIETWNYHYSAGYGSRDYKVSSDTEEGRDEIEVLSATLSEDGKTLSLRTPPLHPANQIFIEYRLRTADGKPLKQTYLHTLHTVSNEKLPDAPEFDALAQAGLNRVSVAKLQPGLLWNFAPVQEPFVAEVWRRKGKVPEGDFISRRMAAISVNSGEPPTPFLQPGPFTATASGFLIAPFSDEYAFELQGEGQVTLEVSGQEFSSGVLVSEKPQRMENIRLVKGYNRVKITLASNARGAARLRILWQGEGFPWEPLPPTALVHSPAISHAVDREGLLLFAQHNCIACHPSAAFDKASQASLQKWFAAPRLTEITSRLKPHWIASWIANPRALRSQARMPHLLAEGEEGKADAADLTAYLLSLSKAEPGDSAKIGVTSEVAAVEAGGRLYETLGCLSCHRLSPPTEADTHDRISLHVVAKKFTSTGLLAFLKNPTAHSPASRMPDFGLTDEEASQLASYLQSKTAANDFSTSDLSAGKADRGRERFEKLRCVHCHEDAKPDRPDIAINMLGSGCLSSKNDGPVSYSLTRVQQIALREWLHMTAKDINLKSSIENASLLMKQYRCNACHDRDLASAPRRSLIEEEGDSGLPAPVIPNLTWTGDKLRRDWLQPFLAGESKIPTRPWLAARMPRFPSIAEPLAQGFAAEHGQIESSPSSAGDFDKEKAQLGASLAAQNQLDCRQCHAIGPLAPRGDDRSQIALGINFALTRDRLHPDFFHRFVLDPARYDIGTRMPKLAEEGRTRAVGILDGDAEAQFDALWQFIRSIPENAPK